MSSDTSQAFIALDSANALADEELSFGGPDLISDDDIDYADIARRTQPDRPGGKIVFDSADYATHEEAMAALEALFFYDLMAPLDEAPLSPIEYTKEARLDFAKNVSERLKELLAKCGSDQARPYQ